MRSILAPCVLMLCLLPLSCTPEEPLHFADWTIPVPEGTEIIGYAHVSDEDRAGTLELDRDLVLTVAYDQPFYQPADVAATADGRIYVLDAGNHRVVVFDADGVPLRSFGGEGQGPGEFASPRRMCLTADQAVVYDSRNRRLSVFALTGELVADHAPAGTLRPQEMKGAGDHLLLVDSAAGFIPPKVAPWIVGKYSLDGERLMEFVEWDAEATIYWSLGATSGSVPMRAPFPVGTFSAEGSAYVTNGDEYQILAVSSEGTASWALRVNYEPPEPSREEKEATANFLIDRIGEMVEGLAFEHFIWPERYPAIENLEVDGKGNLYVFSHAPRSPLSWRQATEPVPVDVYSPEGDRVFSGMSPIDSWHSAVGSHLYRIETDPETEEQIVVRYRLVEPF